MVQKAYGQTGYVLLGIVLVMLSPLNYIKLYYEPLFLIGIRRESTRPYHSYWCRRVRTVRRPSKFRKGQGLCPLGWR